MPSEALGAPLSAAADAFLTVCNTEFNAKQEALRTLWLLDCERYDVDFTHGVVTFTRKQKPPLVFDLLVVGSYARNRGAWEWAWSNPNVVPRLAVPRDVLAPIATKYRLSYLESGFVPVPEERFGWFLSGVALKLTGAIGVHEAEAGDLAIYLLLKTPREI